MQSRQFQHSHRKREKPGKKTLQQARKSKTCLRHSWKMNTLVLAMSLLAFTFLPAKTLHLLRNPDRERFGSHSDKELGVESLGYSLPLSLRHRLLQHFSAQPSPIRERGEPPLVSESFTLGYLHSNPRSAEAVPRGNDELLSIYRSKRYNSKPNSLDLTFHLLRGYLGMARAEKMARKAQSNRLMMESLGK
ncbi:uncharacterized protein LOC103190424 [Callorhinchus milii]|uniref:uncharacterized protein LOC103190424 n=1 Tax=Callorhinchus milii TaxID=7868 RepID=UPI001C3FAD16|nr:uncharacterized protein LOC103190424 [Callorhinchus milii]